MISPASGAYASGAGATAYRDVVIGKAREKGQVAAYSRMLMDPHDPGNLVRYPDEVIVPTGVAHLFDVKQFTCGAENTTSLCDYAVILAVKNVTTTAAVSPSFGSIWESFPTNNSAFSTRVSDFGAAQAAMVGVSTKDRTLSAGIRLALTGLPTGSFMARGRVYCLQLSFNEQTTLQGYLSNSDLEGWLLQMVLAKKGFCMPMKDLTYTNACHVYFPDSPANYDMSASNSTVAQTGQDLSSRSSTVIDGPPFLAVVVCGTGSSLTTLQGTAFQIELASCVEYVPTVAAAGIIPVKSEPPDVAVRNTINKVSQAGIEGRSGARSAGELIQGLKNTFSNPLVSAGLSGLSAMVPGGSIVTGGLKALTMGSSISGALGTMNSMSRSLPMLTNG